MKKFKLIHKTGKIFKDKRGSCKKFLKVNSPHVLRCIQKGTTRANHYHKKDKHFMYIISGELLYSYKDEKNSKVKIKKMKKGDLFFTPAMQEHMAFFLKKTHFLAFKYKKRTQFDYEKDLIRVKMENYPDVRKAILKYSK